MLSKFWLVFLGINLHAGSGQDKINRILQKLVVELQECLRQLASISKAALFWDCELMTQALVIFLFTLGSDPELPNADLIVDEPSIFSHLLKLYLNLLLFQSQSASGHVVVLRDQLSQIFKTKDQRDLSIFHDAVLQGKLPQKFTFNFIRQFTAVSGISFNELNLRKCLTIMVKSRNSSPLSLLQCIGQRIDLQSEAFLVLLKFALDPEGGAAGETWCEKFLLHMK